MSSLLLRFRCCLQQGYTVFATDTNFNNRPSLQPVRKFDSSNHDFLSGNNNRAFRFGALDAHYFALEVGIVWRVI